MLNRETIEIAPPAVPQGRPGWPMLMLSRLESGPTIQTHLLSTRLMASNAAMAVAAETVMAVAAPAVAAAGAATPMGGAVWSTARSATKALVCKRLVPEATSPDVR